MSSIKKFNTNYVKTKLLSLASSQFKVFRNYCLQTNDYLKLMTTEPFAQST